MTDTPPAERPTQASGDTGRPGAGARMEELESRVLLDSAPIFATPFEARYFTNSGAITIPINGYDADALDTLTITAETNHDQVTATVPHLQPEAVHLPPALNGAGRVQRIPVRRPHTRTGSRKRDAGSDAGDTTGHLIQALRQQVRHRRHGVLLHVRQRHLKRAVVDRLDDLHLRVERAIMARTLPPQMDNVVHRLHAIPLRA